MINLKNIILQYEIEFVTDSWIIINQILLWAEKIGDWFNIFVNDPYQTPLTKKLYEYINEVNTDFINYLDELTDISLNHYGLIINPIAIMMDLTLAFIDYISSEPWYKKIQIKGTVEDVKEGENITIYCRGVNNTYRDSDDGVVNNIINFDFMVPSDMLNPGNDKPLIYDCTILVEGNNHSQTITTNSVLSYCFAGGSINEVFTKNQWVNLKNVNDDEKKLTHPVLTKLVELLKNSKIYSFVKTLYNKIYNKFFEENKEQKIDKTILQQRKEQAKKCYESIDYNKLKEIYEEEKELALNNNVILEEYYPGALSNSPNTVFYNSDEVIVGFIDGVEVAKISTLEGEKIIDCIPEIFEVLVKLTHHSVEEFMDKVEKREDVEYVEENTLYTTSLDPNDPYWQDNEQWGHKKHNINKAWDRPLEMEYAFIAIIDTGLNYNHEDLWGSNANYNQLVQYDYVNDDNIADDEIPTDQKNNGHGTEITGIIAAQINNKKGLAGIVPDAECYSHDPRSTPNIGHFKVFKYTGYADRHIISKAIVRVAVTYMPSVICLSVGNYEDDENTIRKAVIFARYGMGCLLFASTGNGANDEAIHIPAAYNSVISVGAYNKQEELWYKQFEYGSNYNKNLKQVDFVGPGESIITTLINGGYGQVKGTSAANAYIAGIAMLWYGAKAASQLNPQIKNCPDDCFNALKNHVKDIGAKGKDHKFGYGIIDAYETIYFKPKVKSRV